LLISFDGGNVTKVSTPTGRVLIVVVMFNTEDYMEKPVLILKRLSQGLFSR